MPDWIPDDNEDYFPWDADNGYPESLEIDDEE